MINRIFKFSHRSVEALPPAPPNHPSSNVEYSDAVESGLRIAVYRSGRRSFRHRFTYRGQKMLMTLGEFPAVSVEKARERVRANKGLLAEDINPLEARERIRQSPTLQQFVEEIFLPKAIKERRSLRDLKSRLQGHILPEFGNRQLVQISRREVILFHQRITGQVSGTTANRSLCLLSSILRHAVGLELIAENPCRAIEKARENGARQRVLSSEGELPRFISALMQVLGTLQGKALYFLLASGLRKSEVLSLAWEHVDLVNGRIFIPRPKNGKPRYAALNSISLELLTTMAEERSASPWVYPSKSSSGHLLDIRRTFNSVCKAAQIEGLRIHDIRRTVATELCSSGQNLIAVRDVLGHADVRTTQRYTHLSLATQKATSEVTADRIRRAMQAS